MLPQRKEDLMGMSKHNTPVVIVCALLCFPFAANGER